ncbi:MAG: 2-oxo-4-hydroxy-4-carboxy-5-ureidoimidazoline decarboxylase [Streptosporangiales bacterium]|nr:2-oxo-4-hydroxy-4-carboxy-5-ureidoimidazoline decarboxylase [Streptosporangiales bacterium]
MSGLDRFNHLDDTAAIDVLLTCCASRGWAQRVGGKRPFPDADALVAAGDAALDRLGWPVVREALDAHPRIGERAPGTGRDAAWSREEQAGAATATTTVAAELADANAAYERRFGHIFLIRAAGRDAAGVLAEAHRRLGDDPATERAETTRELREIVALRLRKLVA